MIITMTILKLVALIFAIWLTSVNICRAYNKLETSSMNFAVMSIAWVIFLTIQFELYK